MIGIDTLWMQLREYKISDDARLKVVPATLDLHSGELLNDNPLFETTSGRIVKGALAKGNYDYFNLTIKNTFSGPAFYVNFNIPKLFHDSEINLEPVGNYDTCDVINSMNICLSGIGVETDVWNSKITRVDMFSNIVPNYDFENYVPVLNCLRAKRMHRANLNYNVPTFLWMNTQAEFTAYDKIDESKNKIKKNKLPQALLKKLPVDFVHRYEYRIKKSRKLESQCGFSDMSRLRKQGGLYGLDILKRNYKKQFKENVFKVDSSELVAWMDAEIETDMVYFEQKHGRNWVSKWLKYRGLSTVKSISSIEKIKKTIQKITGDRNKAWRIEKELDRVLDYKVEDGVFWSDINKLYTELKKKVVYQEIN